MSSRIAIMSLFSHDHHCFIATLLSPLCPCTVESHIIDVVHVIYDRHARSFVDFHFVSSCWLHVVWVCSSYVSARLNLLVMLTCSLESAHRACYLIAWICLACLLARLMLLIVCIWLFESSCMCIFSWIWIYLLVMLAYLLAWVCSSCLLSARLNLLAVPTCSFELLIVLICSLESACHVIMRSPSSGTKCQLYDNHCCRRTGL